MENSSNKLIPASTVLVIRDGLDDIEVFMVVRHHQIDFASGALVFPGGKVDESDLNPEIRRHIVTETEISDKELSYKIAGIRECYEEADVLFANEQKIGRRLAVRGSCEQKNMLYFTLSMRDENQ